MNSEYDSAIQERKQAHIELCRDVDVQALDRFTGFSDVHFLPEALPEIDFEELDTRTNFLGHSFNAPILISGMTGGVRDGKRINSVLAKVAEETGVPMGVGSQRMAIDNPDFEDLFVLKDRFPNLYLLGNVGFAQLLRKDYKEFCQRAIDMIGADALVIHLNALQECVQPEGTRRFRGVLENIQTLCQTSSVPIVVKEVGSGISRVTANRLRNAGVSAIDIAGSGGTSWGYIEGLREKTQFGRTLGEQFRSWGIPTAYNLSSLRRDHPEFPLIASGGIRDGHTVAKAVALGANVVGLALPFLKAALESEQCAFRFMEELTTALKIVMAATGSRNLSDLSKHVCLGRPYQPEGGHEYEH